MIGAVSLVSQANCGSIAKSIFPKNILTIVNHHDFRVFEYSVSQFFLSFTGTSGKSKYANRHSKCGKHNAS